MILIPRSRLAKRRQAQNEIADGSGVIDEAAPTHADAASLCTRNSAYTAIISRGHSLDA